MYTWSNLWSEYYIFHTFSSLNNLIWMEQGCNPTVDAKMVAENRVKQWQFGQNEALAVAGSLSIRGTLSNVISCVEEAGPKPMVSFGNGDPSLFPCFRTTPIAEDAIVEAVRSAKHNHYSPFVGLLPARRYVVIYLLFLVLFLSRWCSVHDSKSSRSIFSGWSFWFAYWNIYLFRLSIIICSVSVLS